MTGADHIGPRQVAKRILDGDALAAQLLGELAASDRGLLQGEFSARAVDRRALRNVLRALVEHTIEPRHAAEWAALVRWGEAGRWSDGDPASVLVTTTPFNPGFDIDIIEDEVVGDIIAFLDDSAADDELFRRCSTWLEALDQAD